MNTMANPKELNHKDTHKIVYTFEVPGETILALYNALSFTLNHVEHYTEEVDKCEECLDALHAFRKYLSKVLDYSEIYSRPKEAAN
jgi:hypothetical protein